MENSTHTDLYLDKRNLSLREKLEHKLLKERRFLDYFKLKWIKLENVLSVVLSIPKGYKVDDPESKTHISDFTLTIHTKTYDKKHEIKFIFTHEDKVERWEMYKLLQSKNATHYLINLRPDDEKKGINVLLYNRQFGDFNIKILLPYDNQATIREVSNIVTTQLDFDGSIALKMLTSNTTTPISESLSVETYQFSNNKEYIDFLVNKYHIKDIKTGSVSILRELEEQREKYKQKLNEIEQFIKEYPK